jgi:hypothetical protein
MQDDSAFKSTCIFSFFLPFKSILRQFGVKQAVMCNSAGKRLKGHGVPPIQAPLFTGMMLQKTLMLAGRECHQKKYIFLFFFEDMQPKLPVAEAKLPGNCLFIDAPVKEPTPSGRSEPAERIFPWLKR